MDLEKLAQLSVGLAAAIAVLWIVLVKGKPRNGANKAGERSTEEWEGRMQKMHTAASDKIISEFRSIMESRYDKLRQIFREELDKWRRR